MSISAIIVSYKVRDLVLRCLASVAGSQGAEIETFLVDNASGDGTVEAVREKFPSVTIIANEKNVGFAKAVNTAVRQAKGEYVLLLNPDTELAPDSLAAMAEFMARHPKAAVVGPKLVNEDGSLQPSVRRLPTPGVIALVMLKLHRLMPFLPSVRRYLAEDFDYSRPAPVEQVMGAAFLVRRAVWDRLGGLDERFFVWFEEVDFCKRARDAGLEVWYAPVTTVRHAGGASFGQVFGPLRKRMFNRSGQLYIRKHFGRVAALMLLALHPASMALEWLAVWLSRPFFIFFSAFLAVDALSFVTWHWPAAGNAIFVAAITAALALAVVRYELLILLFVAELFVGSQGGALLAWDANGPSEISLRLALFLVMIGAGFGRSRQWRRSLARAGLLIPLAALFAAVAIGVGVGILAGNPFGAVFFDANGYFYLAAFPAIAFAMADSMFRRRAALLLAAAVTAGAIKAAFVFFIFSHRLFAWAKPAYLWIRDSRTGEITIVVGDFHRVFFQSFLFALVLLFPLFLSRIYRRRGGKAHEALLVACAFAMLLSLSRSFWFGGFAAAAALVALLALGRAPLIVWRRLFTTGTVMFVVATLLIGGLYVFPFPKRGAPIDLAALLAGRAFSTGDAAAGSRWALLPELVKTGLRHPVLGSGFGTTVTYRTSDPRVLATNPTGEYRTFSFEWGYHDLWVKFGLVGLAAYAWLIWVVCRPLLVSVRRGLSALRNGGDEKDRHRVLLDAGVLLGLVALLATNVFSPYLNHPLGIGLIALVAGWGVRDARV